MADLHIGPELRVVFVGASGTGKSTLSAFVANRYKLPTNPNGSRALAAELGFANPYDVDRANELVYDVLTTTEGRAPDVAARAAIEAHQARAFRGVPLWSEKESRTMRPRFQKELQRRKIEWELTNHRFVSDRATIDDLAYAILHCREVVDDAFLERANAHMRNYDVVFYTPLAVGQWLANDPARVTSLSYHYVFDALIFGLLSRCSAFTQPGPRVVVLAKADLDVRKGLVERTIDSVLAWKNVR